MKNAKGKDPRGKKTSMPTMEVNGTDICLPQIEEAEKLALARRKSDEELAREYAEMIDSMYMDVEELDLSVCAPDRRFYKSGREAWVYDHGKIAELVFIR